MRWMLVAMVVWLWSPVVLASPLLNATLLVAAEASLAIDAMQTFDIRNDPRRHELNPILGPHPTDAAIVAYFGTAMAATATATYLLPERWRFLAPLLVLALQVPQIVRNDGIGCGMRLPF